MLIITIGSDRFNVPGTIESPDFSVFPASVQPSLQEAFENGDYVYREDIAPPPVPDWDGFLTPFYAPEVGGIYDSIATPVQASTAQTQEHWANTRMGLISPIVRTPQWLHDSWEYLKFLLNADGNPLSAETIAACEALMNQYHVLP